MKNETFNMASSELNIKDIELTLRIRRNPAESIVIEIKDGGAQVTFERNVVKDMPFKEKRKRK